MLGAMQIRTAKEIGLLVRDHRRRQKLTQAQLAKRLRVSRLWVLQLEQGKDTAQVGLVLMALNQLGIPLQVGPPPKWPDVVREGRDVDIDEIIRNATGPLRQ